ncbi:hypothetical protein VDG1235_391 [Verrucomicrobiia bacterium DG1235]|nr:hypothetical protein VDG1235_391 [Verrucomicrobiae bacterium DG1235]
MTAPANPKKFLLSLCVFIIPFSALTLSAEESLKRFNKKNDLLLAHFDSKTDVDDIHSIAAFATIVANEDFADLNYHAVAGAYGIQEGLYVPANELFTMAFDKNWSDAHTNFDQAVSEVHKLTTETLISGGDVWIAECGQSDFTAAVVGKIHATHPAIDTQHRIHLVQHSNWNQDAADPQKLQFVKTATDYHKIPDGNATGNGTSGFNTELRIDWSKSIKDPHLTEIWKTAVAIANRYNGKDGRYLNHAISAGGFDFSDTAEVVWILELENVPDAPAFFTVFGY